MKETIESILQWFRVDNLQPELRYGYPSSTGARILHMDIEGYSNQELNGRVTDIPDAERNQLLSVFQELRELLGRHNDDNKIVIGYKRKDTGTMIYIGWYESMRNIGMTANNRDGAESSRPWNI